MKQFKNVPVLRFSEFDEEWKLIQLGSLLTFKNGVNATKEQYGKGIKFINVLDIINNNTITHDRIIGAVDISEKEYLKNEVKYGDILFQRSSETREEVGQSNVYLDRDVNATFGGFVIRGQAIQPYFPEFLNYLLKTSAARNEITSKSGGSTRYNVGQETLREVSIILPDLPEQEKIASFITSIDCKIQQLSKKKGLLEQYKRSVMQQIFNQEIRFKDDEGNDFADWEEKRLGDIAKVYDGTHMTPDYTDSGIPFYSVEHVTANNFSKTKFISESVYEKENKRVKLERGDILMTRIGDIGTSKLIDWDVNASFYVSLALIKKSKSFNTKYLNQFIKSIHFQSELHKRIIHVAFPKKINLGEISNCHVFTPCLDEQEKIADFLSSIDQKIELVSRQLDKTQIFKKGLLQGMFV